MYKLHDWIDINKINWECLTSNPNAINLLKQNKDKIDWNGMSSNQNAIDFLEKNMDKINWYALSKNQGAMSLLKKNINKIQMMVGFCFLYVIYILLKKKEIKVIQKYYY